MKSFSSMKFCALPRPQQHKKCAELLRLIYRYREEKRAEELSHEYERLCAFLSIPPLTSLSIEDLEQRFHEHMKGSGRGIQEADFLCHLSTSDKKEGGPWLSVHTYLDGLRSAHNVGNIVRTVEAFRLGHLHLSSDMMPTDHRQLIKTSMNSWKAVEMHHGSSVESLPKPMIAVETVLTACAWNEWIYPSSCTIVLGNEE